MTEADRITQINHARTSKELDQALAGLTEQIVAAHPDLARNYPLNMALQTQRYLHALCDLRRATHGVRGGDYREFVDILEAAAEKQLWLKKL
jgi:hypothetical protein